MAVTISEKPWSDYTAADYTPEQWHAACLIHQHEGAPTSKNQCKLPIRTPTGTLSRNGVHAAAGALAGARGGVNASAEEKAVAANALIRAYKQLGEEPPSSLQHSLVENYLAHFGKKGMKWGVRNDDSGVPSQRAINKASTKEARGIVKSEAKLSKADANWAKNANSFKTIVTVYNGATKKMNDTEISRINSISKYKKAGDEGKFLEDTPIRREYYKEYQKTFLNALKEQTNALPQSPSGRKKYVIYSPGLTDGSSPFAQWDITIGDIHHAMDTSPKIKINYDDQGRIVSFELAKLESFLAHFGKKGMKWGVRRSDAQLGKTTSPGVSEDKARAIAVSTKVGKSRNTSSLSNKEMQDLITRMNLEQQYSRLTNKPSKTEKGFNAVKKTLEVANTANQVISLLNSPTGKMLKKSMETKKSNPPFDFGTKRLF